MARHSVPYNRNSLEFELPDEWNVEYVEPQRVSPATDPKAAVEAALSAPVGGFSWQELSKRVARAGGGGPDAPAPGGASARGPFRVAIAVNDKTRPVPHGHLLPPLLERLEAAGIAAEHIRLIIATGTHPPMTESEFPAVLPQRLLERYHVVSHDAGDESVLEAVGTTSRGTPVRINRLFLSADLRIVIGNIEPHQFMGYSGGVKSAVIGLAGKDTINHNHAMMSLPEAMVGRFDDNPARQDVEEMGRMVRVDLALNVILNDHKEIIEAVAGNPTEVMQRGIPRVCELYTAEVDEPLDLVIASPGGYPKDINVYQAQKGLAHASLVTREGGAIIVAAACVEGSGSESYEAWVSRRRRHEQVLDDFAAEGYRVGPHKAFQIAREATRFAVAWVTDMPPELSEKLLLRSAASVEAAAALPAVEAALRGAGSHIARGAGDRGTAGDPSAPGSPGAPGRPRVGIMPLANATIPRVRSESRGGRNRV